MTVQDGSAYTWEGNGTIGDLVDITGNISLPSSMSVTVSGSLPEPAVAFRWTGSNTGVTDLSGWSVSGGVKAVIVGNEVRFVPEAGTVFYIR